MATSVIEKKSINKTKTAKTNKTTNKDDELINFEELKQFIITNINNDIDDNAKYIISYFRNNNIEVTNLKLQKLLYFLEAIYMVALDENYLFNENFYAWNYGPVSKKVYDQYKIFGSMPIILDEPVSINRTNEIFIQNLFMIFNDYSVSDLIEFSHQKGSPWYEIYMKYGENIPKNEVIQKYSTKKWFSGIVVKNGEN